MSDSVKDKAEGLGKQAAGSVKAGLGHVTGDRKLEAEGEAEKLGGKVQKKVGDVEKVFEK